MHSPHAELQSHTAFGAQWAGISQTAAVLRGQAASSVDLAKASDVDLVAAVVAAHAWGCVTNETTLRGAHRHPRSVRQVAAAVLARAAGRAGDAPHPDPHDHVLAVLDDMGHLRARDVTLARFAPALTWAADVLSGVECRDALLAAGLDLTAGGRGAGEVAGIGVLLLLEAADD